MTAKVLVIGGTGAMGCKIVRLLPVFAPDTEIIVATHRTQPGGFSSRPWDHSNPEEFTDALHGIRVVIDAAGPFDRDPSSTIRACARAGAHYVDIAECATWIDRARVAARGARTAVVPGASTFPGLLEILAANHQEQANTRARAFLLMASNQPPGMGMLLGLLSPLGRRMNEGGRAFSTLESRHGALYGSFPTPSLFSGQPTPIPTLLRVGFDQRALTRALCGAAKISRFVPRWALPTIARTVRPLANAAALVGGSRGRLEFELQDSSGLAMDRTTIESTTDPLEVPAIPAVLAATALIRETTPSHGYRSTADFVSREDLILAIERRGGHVWLDTRDDRRCKKRGERTRPHVLSPF